LECLRKKLGGDMRKLGLLALFALIVLASPLFGEIVYSISEPTTLNVPYPYTSIYYETAEDTLVHFYNNVTENGQINLYHFTLNDSLQFSAENLIASVDTLGTGITEMEMIQVYDSSTFHLYYNTDYQHTKLVSKLIDYDQIEVTQDILSQDVDLVSCYSVCDSLLLLTKRYRTEIWADRYSEFYKFNLDTSELALFRTNINYYEEYLRIGTEILFDSPYTNSKYHYDNSMTFVDSLVINSDGYPYDMWIYSDRVENFGDGVIIAYNDGLIQRTYSYVSYFEFRPGELIIQLIASYDAWSLQIVSESKMIGLTDSFEMGPLDRIAYTGFDGTDWFGSEFIDFDYGYQGHFFAHGYYILYGNNEDHRIFTVYDQELNVVYQFESQVLGNGTYPVGSFYNNLFIRDNVNNSISYCDFEVVVPNSEDTNPEIVKSITATNYPNPFNPETTIEYSVPVSGDVNINI
jgi:hypothetical protein